MDSVHLDTKHTRVSSGYRINGVARCYLAAGVKPFSCFGVSAPIPYHAQNHSRVCVAEGGGAVCKALPFRGLGLKRANLLGACDAHY